ncbi:protein SPT2 homolog [Schistocerca piceifrons]|uniref:protein SPT2 homolog n=1 Tax=Schistocerca piceifrons TaxID=274613 RepID=UPI001F5F4919|nr:protein SPT2 homolog [Schistocerca piceifrons]
MLRQHNFHHVNSEPTRLQACLDNAFVNCARDMYSTKRGLCCFPGFSNTGTTSRKGKLPKPLLAGVGRTGSPHHLFEPSGFLQGLVPTRYEQGRPEEILLLEKQGRSSQQQCAASLPPTSLPRPPRRPPAGSGAGYGRLGDGSASGSESHGPVPPSPPRRPPAGSGAGYGRLGDGSASGSESHGPVPPSPPRRPPAGSGAGYGRLGDGSASGSESHGPVPPSPPRRPPAGSGAGYGRLGDGSASGSESHGPVPPSPPRRPPAGSGAGYGRLGDGSASGIHSNGQPSSSGVARAEGAKLRLFTGPRSRRSSSVAKPASTDSSNASSKSVASTAVYSIASEKRIIFGFLNYYGL